MAKRKTSSINDNTKQQFWLRIGLITLIVIGFLFYFKNDFKKLYKRYFVEEKFIPGRMSFPDHYHIFGIDISRWQPNMHWDDLKAISTYGDTIELSFVIIKATEGAYSKDKKFSRHIKNARENENLTVGAYHYFLPNRDPKLQANNFIATAQLRSGDLAPVIDIEETNGQSKEEIIQNLKIMCDILEKKYHIKPIIYTFKDYCLQYLMDDFQDYPFWIAHYYEKDIEMPPEIEVKFWQFTDKGKTLSFKGFIDVNAFMGNRSQLNKLKIP